ncbi:hypothetical protein FJ366_00935 [Candidatus Dependentiae bacterium]|nr:hypothetical protein [Candidatus Dependentiae bacterium]
MNDFKLAEVWNRYTNRSFSEKNDISEQQIELLFEAAGRAPSSFNAQPWRFIYGEKGSQVGEQLFSLLKESNATWARNASWYVLLGAVETVLFKGSEIKNDKAFFDSGAACQNFVLQATHMGLATAVIGGFDYQAAATLVGNYMTPVCMIIVGHFDDAEPKVSTRRALSEIAKKTFE